MSETNQPIPRMRRVGGGISQHQDSSQVASFFQPVRGVRDQMERAGIKPPNHARDNVKAIRELSAQNRAKKELEEYEKAQPKGPKARPAPRPLLPNSTQMDDGRRDYVSENILVAASTRPPPKGEPEKENPLQKKDYGRVPMYLQERKIEMFADKLRKKAEEEAAKVPAGMRLLPEDERLETLGLLKKSKEEVEREIGALPFVIETPSMVRHKTALESRLKEVEEAIRVFSRTNILVKAV